MFKATITLEGQSNLSNAQASGSYVASRVFEYMVTCAWSVELPLGKIKALFFPYGD